MSEAPSIQSVTVTGATGFVGRAVVRELLAKGLRPVCLVRSAEKLRAQHPEVDPERLTPIVGRLKDRGALREAADVSQAAIHLAGIIIARPLRGQTFAAIHMRGTANVVDAAQQAGIRRYVHMSALGARPDARSTYHRTKWTAEEYVRRSGLDWTIFRPSLIHGPDGEFMRLMKRFMCGFVPPVIPYFGSGQAKVQPVSVKDVAYCFVQSLLDPTTIGKVFPLGGPKAYSWIELYNACRALMPGAKHWKPVVSQPVPLAKLTAILGQPIMGLAETVVPSLGLFRFDAGQVQMSQEDATCDRTIAEKAFNFRTRDFEEELSAYAERIP
jgi:NADH dehydrogenase